MKRDPNEILARFASAQSDRSPFETDWRECARHVLPSDYGTWQTSGATNTTPNPQFTIPRRTVFDTTAMRAMPKFAAILERILTPQGHTWHRLRDSDDKLMKRTNVLRYYDELNSVLFHKRYEPRANFQPVQSAGYMSLGAYGNGVKFIGARKDRQGLLYMSCPLQQCYWLQNDEGHVDTMFRRMSLTARQCAQKFTPEKLPPKIKQEFDKDERQSDQKKFDIIHCVAPADDYRDDALDHNRFKYMSIYVSQEDKVSIGEPSGYNSFPFVVPRHFTVDNTPYAYSIAQLALGSINTVNQMKKTLLKQGQKAVDPPLLAHDDGVVNGRLDMRPAAVNYGAVDSQGRLLVHPMVGGNIAVGEKGLELEQDDIKDAFFVTLFEILVEKEDMSATEVMARAVDKATLLAPTMGLMQCSDIGPMIEREIEVLGELRMLPEMPPELKEAHENYVIGFTSPLAKTMSAEATKGFIDMVNFAVEVAAQAQKPELLNRFNFDRAMPDIAYERGVPSLWLNSDEELAALKKQQSDAQAVDSAGRIAPAVAGAAKAAAALPPQALAALSGGSPPGAGGPPGGAPPGLPALPPSAPPAPGP